MRFYPGRGRGLSQRYAEIESSSDVHRWNIYNERELIPEATIRKFRIVQMERLVSEAKDIMELGRQKH